jgi:sigma-B regulation protein RsbU (phosphoserine phosphatase)
MNDELYQKGPFGFIAFADNGEIFTLNETAAEVLKYPPGTLEGADIEKIFTLPTRIFYQTHFFPLVKMHGYAEEIFVSLLCSDGGQLPVLLNARRLQSNGITLTCLAFVVVKNRKKFEDELVAARNTAQRALQENTELLKMKAELELHASNLDEQISRVNRQNEELQQFSHVITHSLKEPLRKVLMYSSMIRDTADTTKLEKMIGSAHKLNQVVTALQQYVWINQKIVQFTEVDLNAVLKNAFRQVEGESAPGVIRLHHDHLVSLEGDADQLEILMYHILQNAARFRKNDVANVTVTTVVVKRNKFRNFNDKYRYEDFVKIEVTDDGTGFEMEFSKQIFELFQKLKQNDGQGLGLALCKRIVDNHEGFIEAESSLGSYTKIIAWLPLRHQKNK